MTSRIPFPRHMSSICGALTLLPGVAFAEILYQETFDGPGRAAEQSVTDSEMGWVGTEFKIRDGGHLGSGLYLEGSTAQADKESIFYRKIPPVTEGVVTLTCDVWAGPDSLHSNIGFISKTYSDRRVEWSRTQRGWMLWSGRIDEKGPAYTDQPEGPILADQEELTCPAGVPTKLSLSVDMSRNKTWGELEWTDAQGVVQKKKTRELQWDPLSGVVGGLSIIVDRRSGRTGLEFDNIKVEGTPHQLKPHPFKDGTNHKIYQMNGREKPFSSPAEIQWISEKWPEGNAQMPYLVWLPETKELLMMVECKQPIVSAFIRSKDGGKTWSDRTWLQADKDSPLATTLGLTYLGNGKVRGIYGNRDEIEWTSADGGHTWRQRSTPTTSEQIFYFWDTALVLSPETKDQPARFMEAGYRETGLAWGAVGGAFSQGYLRETKDGGLTFQETKVPEWLGLNEITLIKAANGDLVAAARTDLPERMAKTKLDHYAGLAVSRSSDEGKTWTKPDVLFEWGRHHPSMVVLPNGDLLMTYVVRLGYTRDAAGFMRFGVEAIISKDNGKTWDLDHRIVLATWTGDIKGDNAWFSGTQSSSTVQLPDGTLVTAFGMGIRNKTDTTHCLMDVGLVRWTLPNNPINNDRTISNAPYNSDKRNLLDPPALQ